jgi:hypothetical protein
MILTKDEYDEQVVEAEPELLYFDASILDRDERERLSTAVIDQFDFEHNSNLTNWDRNLEYPRGPSNVNYSYHANLFRQVAGDSEEISLSWIQAMDLALVADKLGYDDISQSLEEFAENFQQ